ncbi:MAG: GMC family oxidoreductase [Scytonema sp. PMC 1070.18]|nr:GMC family oxidoreductase [Scytonema sp. PMC 1070.18]
MLQDINQFKSGTPFETDICLVGAGAAGIDISRFFNGTDNSVLLVESGDIKYKPEVQKLYKMKCIGKNIRDGGYKLTDDLAQFKGECRIRMFGGTTNIWSGKWKMLDPVDFAKKNWVPFSGWPICYDELLPYYQEIAQEYSIPDAIKYLLEKQETEIKQSLLGKTQDIKYTIHCTEEPPTNFGKAFYRELEESSNVTVLFNANAYELILSDEHNRIEQLTLKSLDGKEYSVIAKVFILTCGGLENARLLLASNKQMTTGIGNSKDLVGRFYMDHPKGRLGIIKPLSSYLLPKYFHLEPKLGKSFTVGFSLAPAKQQQCKTFNHNLYLEPVYDNKIRLFFAILDKLKTAFNQRNYYQLMKAGKEFIIKFSIFYKIVIKIMLGKPINEVIHYEIAHYLEQSPNYESRLFLGEEVDTLGMRKITIDWRLSSLDQEYFFNFLDEIKKVFSEIKFGEMMIDEEKFKNLNFVKDASHHMGTTRMGSTPDDGVVDFNCKVFGIDNLYIAGSSVFPTGGNANPTYTILALSRRLCHHLKIQLLAVNHQPSTIGRQL